MFISHKNIYKVFAYECIHKNDPPFIKRGKLFKNLVHGMSYLPILGVITNLGLAALTSVYIHDKAERKQLVVLWSCRAIASLAGPVILPTVDLLASIRFARCPKPLN